MSELLCEVTDGVARVVINRPKQRNSVTLAMWRGIGDAFTRFGEDKAVRTIMLMGAGDHFSAGADILEFEEIRDDRAQSTAYEEAVDYAGMSIASVAKPTIAVCRGYCLGGGAHLAMSCDFRFADPDAIFGIPAAKLSIVYGVQGTRKLLALVGLTEAKRILFSGGRFDANYALNIGFVDNVTEDPLAEAEALAARLQGSAPLTIAGAKYILNGLALGGFDPEEADRFIDEASDSHDYREGRAAFAEKRPPHFRGD